MYLKKVWCHKEYGTGDPSRHRLAQTPTGAVHMSNMLGPHMADDLKAVFTESKPEVGTKLKTDLKQSLKPSDRGGFNFNIQGEEKAGLTRAGRPRAPVSVGWVDRMEKRK